MTNKRSRAKGRKKITVLLAPIEAERFEEYCEERGFKKSTLIARLVREHLDSEQFRSSKVRRS